MENDQYLLANEKLINESWNEHYRKLDEQFTGMDEYPMPTSWGGGRYNSPPF